MKQARFVAEARQEFLTEVAYYNEAQSGLAIRFTKAVEEAASRALAFPLLGRSHTWPLTRRSTRTLRQKAWLRAG